MAGDSQKNVALTFGANIALAGMNAVTGIVLARLLGPEGRGQLQAVQLWGLFIGTIAALGVQEAVVYFVARRRDEAGSILASALLLNLLSGLVFTAVAWFVVPTLLGSQSDEIKHLAQLFVVVIPVYALSGAPMQALRGAGAFGRWNVLRLLPSTFWLVAVVGAWATGHLSVQVLAFGFVATQVLLFVVVSIAAMTVVRGPYRPQPSTWPRLLRFGLPSVLGTVPQMLNLRLDQLLMAAFVSTTDLGLYVTAVAWTGVLSPVLGALGSVLFPRLASEASMDERLRILAKGFRLAVVIALLTVVPILAVTYPGIRLLFGSAFLPAVPAAMVLIVAGGVLSVSGVLQDGYRGLGRPAEVLWSELSGLVATALFLLLLLPRVGIIGAAIASLAGYTTTTVVLVVRLRTVRGTEPPPTLRPGREDVRGVMRALRSLLGRRAFASATDDAEAIRP